MAAVDPDCDVLRVLGQFIEQCPEFPVLDIEDPRLTTVVGHQSLIDSGEFGSPGVDGL